ncbi:glycosyltransferase [Vulcanisaeta distributa]|uniref:glycosyltransferase n=1 Tax=Vulcanisaeta distributa TaxID=164451 RepID=UPI001FB54009|nr:glycosyltransferase [Vulcanisaeta distributa]
MRVHGNRVHERDKANTVPAHKLPFVSILIPIKNENIMTIERSLQAIASLNYPKELFEVLYISDDPEYYVNSLTKIIIPPMSRRLGINVKVLRRTVNKGYKGGALNYGIKHAKGDVIAVFDVDTIMPSDYLQKAVIALLNGYDAVTAVWRGYYTVDNSVSRLLKFMYDLYSDVFIRGRFLGNGFPIITSNNLVIWRKVLDLVNGFCECTGEDLNLTIKLRSRGGYRIGLIDSIVYSEVPQTYLAFKKQFSRWLFNGIWSLKHDLKLILTSREVTIWEKIDSILWMLQIPSTSFVPLSILITIVLSVIGVLIPPISITLLEILNTSISAILGIILLLFFKKMGYKTWDFLTNMAKAISLMILISFPMLVYSIESLITDEWEWIPTPKGPSPHHMRIGSFKDLVHELFAILILVIAMVVLILYKQLLTTIYVLSIMLIMMYSLRFTIPQKALVKQ